MRALFSFVAPLRASCGVQVADGDLIGASTGAMAALLRARPHGVAWMDAASLTLDVYTNVLVLLTAAHLLPGPDAAVVDACWKRCGRSALCRTSQRFAGSLPAS